MEAVLVMVGREVSIDPPHPRTGHFTDAMLEVSRRHLVHFLICLCNTVFLLCLSRFGYLTGVPGGSQIHSRRKSSSGGT